jgi:hypothetical protein
VAAIVENHKHSKSESYIHYHKQGVDSDIVLVEYVREKSGNCHIESEPESIGEKRCQNRLSVLPRIFEVLVRVPKCGKANLNCGFRYLLCLSIVGG